MAQARKRPSVTLTLDPEIRARAMALLDQMPGKPSFSQLVDELVQDFVETMEPMLAEIKASAGGNPMSVVRQLLGEQMLKFADEIRDAPATVEEWMRKDPAMAALTAAMAEHGEDAARAVEELRKRQE